MNILIEYAKLFYFVILWIVTGSLYTSGAALKNVKTPFFVHGNAPLLGKNLSSRGHRSQQNKTQLEARNSSGEVSRRTALVTGSGRGIGACIAERLSSDGVGHVICISRSGCDEVVDRIKKNGGQASSYRVDVTKSKDVSALCEKILEEHKSIDILVNNAGITKDSLFLRMTESQWEEVIDTNLNSLFYFTHPIVKKMITNRYGRIINITSVVGVGGNIGQANYAASKSAVIGFTRSLAKEVAQRNITVNAVAPGFIQTTMTDKMSQQARDMAVSKIPMGRMGTTDEVASAVSFLASDDAGYITGRVMPVDGGMLFGGN